MHNVEAWRREVQGQVFLGRRVGTGHYGFMHNVEVGVGELSEIGGIFSGVGWLEAMGVWGRTLWLYA
jgi:hypothetical protein